VLTILGDNAANSVTVTAQANGDLLVSGLSSGNQTFSGVTTLNADLMAGNDTMTIDLSADTSLVLALTINGGLGVGNDTLTFTANGTVDTSAAIDINFDGGIGIDTATFQVSTALAAGITVENFETVTGLS
jgi:hypothetical protein